MRQRAMIAMALACRPDAPDRRRAHHRPRRDHPGADPGPDRARCKRSSGMAVLLITHDLGVVAEICRTGGGHVRGAGGRERRGRRALPPTGATPTRVGLLRLACRGSAASGSAAADPRRGAEPARPAAGLRASRTAASSAARALRRATRRWQEIARGHHARCWQPLEVRTMNTDPAALPKRVAKHYPARGGRASRPARVWCWRWRTSPERRGGRGLRAGGGERLRQVHPRPGARCASRSPRRAA